MRHSQSGSAAPIHPPLDELVFVPVPPLGFDVLHRDESLGRCVYHSARLIWAGPEDLGVTGADGPR